MGRLLARIILVPLGYCVAVFAAVALIAAVEWARASAYPAVANDPMLLGATALAVLTDAVVLFWLIGTFALLPAIAIILIAEIWSVRSWLFYVATGGATAFILTLIPELLSHPALPDTPTTVAATGFAGGLAYWLIAGRSAGRGRPLHPPGETSPPAPRAA